MKKWLIFVICLVVVFAAGFIGSIANGDTTSSEWYELNKPAITPPGFVFPIVWNILYLLIAISLYFIWTKSKKKERGMVAWVFGINIVLNALWSVIFFGYRQPGWAFFEIILLWLSIVSMIFVAGRIDKKSGWLLVPYLLWVTFAGVLNTGYDSPQGNN
jgi:translocator protein